MRIVAAIPSLSLIAGCALGAAWPDLPRLFPAGMLAGAVCLAVAALRGGRARTLVAASVAGALSTGMLLAGAAWREAWRPPLRVLFDEMARPAPNGGEGRLPGADGAVEEPRASVVVVGKLRADAALGESGTVSLDLAAEWLGRAGQGARDLASNPVQGGVRLSVAGALAPALMHEWRRGRTVRVVAQLRRASRYLDPGVPDGERALARRAVSLVGSVKSGGLVTVLARGSVRDETAASVRAFTRGAIADSVGRWSATSAGIIAAIVIGDRTGLDADVERRLQEAGTYHVIAISGGNIALLAGLALAGFRAAGVLGPPAMVVAMAGLLAYGAIVAGGASVERASAMAIVYLAGRALDLRGPPLNALAVVAAFLLLRQPLVVTDPAFVLTCGATFAILLVPRVGNGSQRWRAVVSLGLASLAAELALMPVSAWWFSRVTFAGLALNYAAIPLMAVAQIAGMAAVPLTLVSPPVAAMAGWVAHAGAKGLVASAGLVDLMPIVTWRVAAPAVWVVVLYYAGAAAALALWYRTAKRPVVSPVPRIAARMSQRSPDAGLRLRQRVAVTAWLFAAVWILAEPWAVLQANGDGRLHVTFIDVGQGDAAIVRFPRGETMLVDTGGVASGSTFDIGDRVVGPVLREQGIRRLDTLVVSHGDADHAAGAVSVVRDFVPWDIWEGVPVPRSPQMRAIRDGARSRRARWTQVQTGDRVEVGDIAVTVHHPPPPDWERQQVRNDDSSVLELRWGEVSVVLTGDIGRDVERQIASRFEPAALRVVKVPHHGSQTSSSDLFVKALHPQVAVVSAGRGNMFGHPAPAVLERYTAVGAAIYRTDRDGAVTISSDGHSLDVRTFTGHTQHFDAAAPAKQSRGPKNRGGRV